MITQPLWRFANGYPDTPSAALLAAALSSDAQVPSWNPATGWYVGPRNPGESGSTTLEVGMMKVADFFEFVQEGDSAGAAFADAIESRAAISGAVELIVHESADPAASLVPLASWMACEPGGWISIDMADDPIGPLEVLYEFLLEVDPPLAAELLSLAGDRIAILSAERMVVRPSHLECESLVAACAGRPMWSPTESKVFHVSESGVFALDDVTPQALLEEAAHNAPVSEGSLRPSSITELRSSPILMWVNERPREYPLADQLFDVGQMISGQDPASEAIISAALAAMRNATKLAELESATRDASGAVREPARDSRACER